MRCDGYDSCEGVNTFITASTSGTGTGHSGNLYFTGRQAVLEDSSKVSVISTTPEGTPLSSLVYDIIVTGNDAVQYQELEYENNLYCMTWFTCRSAHVLYVNNVYSYGTGGLYDGNISNTVVQHRVVDIVIYQMFMVMFMDKDGSHWQIVTLKMLMVMLLD